MNFFRKKAVYITAAVMSILCIVAIYISVRVTLVMLEKGNHIIKGHGVLENTTIPGTAAGIADNGTINGKFTEQELFFNGRKVEGFYSYISGKEELAVPLDSVLGQASVGFDYYHPDDIIQADINGQKLLMKLWSCDYSVDGKRITLGMAPMPYNGHILVPLELFSYIRGFSTDLDLAGKTAFINYTQGYTPEKDKTVCIIKLDGKVFALNGREDKNVHLPDVISDAELTVDDSIKFSPDKMKIIFHKEGKGTYAANADRTRQLFLGRSTEADWIGNNKIFASMKEGRFIIDKNSRSKLKVENDFYIAGLTATGDIFYTDGYSLYSESNAKDDKILDLPWKCDYVYAAGLKGPYIIVSLTEDSVFYMYANVTVKIGESGRLAAKPGQAASGGGKYNFYNSSITASPDKKNMAVLLRANKFMEVNIMSPGKTEPDRLVLDYYEDDTAESAELYVKWISNDRIIICSKHKGWIITLNDTDNKDYKAAGEKCFPSVYEWVEKEGSEICGILP